MPPISCAKRSAARACWAGTPTERRGEACDTGADTIRATVLGGTTPTTPHVAPRAFGCSRLETALIGTTPSTTGLHPTLDSLARDSTAFVSHSIIIARSRTRLLSPRDPPN